MYLGKNGKKSNERTTFAAVWKRVKIKALPVQNFIPLKSNTIAAAKNVLQGGRNWSKWRTMPAVAAAKMLRKKGKMKAC